MRHLISENEERKKENAELKGKMNSMEKELSEIKSLLYKLIE